MKISSTYLFDSSLKNIQSTQSDVSRSREKIASGKSLTRASDDTSKLRNIETLQSNLKKIDSFDSNLSYLKDRLKLEESVLGSASDILIRLKELALQAANDTLMATDRDIIAAEAKNLRDELLSIANTRDVEGNYVFGGSRTEILPFKKDDVTGAVEYQGDNRQTRIQISGTREMAKNRDGQSIFEGASRTKRTYQLAGFEGEGDYNFQIGERLIQLKVGAGTAEEVAAEFNTQLKRNGVSGTASVRHKETISPGTITAYNGAVTISDGTNSVALDFSAGDPGNIDTLISNIRSAPGYGDLLFTVDKAANGVDIEYNWKEAGSGYELETVTVGTLASYTGLTIGDGTNSITPTVPGGGFASVDALVTAIQSATNYASLDFTVSKASNGTDIEYLWKKPGIQTGTATYTAAGITNEAIASSTLGPEKARVSYTASVSSGSAPGITASGGSDVYAVTLTGEDSLATDGVKITPEISATTPLTVRLQEDEKDNIDYFSVLQDFVNALSSNDRGQIGRAVSEITGVQEQLSVTMGDVGSSLNNVDRQSGINSDVRLQIDQLLASERDLDYAKAVTQFNQEIVRLEATQASFARIAQLSLFQYLS
ncbi:MAG: flagellar hook-associated protein 3 [Gammaproteobacteria bacterium]|nr:flagellar hook-associated protein 3 [Gammaproteobacteria bacterium]